MNSFGNKNKLFDGKYSNSIQDKSPVAEPFPFPCHFSTPARYHNPEQQFKVGDLVWYEVRGNFGITDKGIQWGEAVIKQVFEDDTFQLAGKCWKYDFFHPLVGLAGGPAYFSSISDVHTARSIYKQWAISSHPNFHVRRLAMSNVDEVEHSFLARVPREAMFKVWDRESEPPCPVSSLNLNKSMQDEKTLESMREEYGQDLGFRGMKQGNYGPEMWGISLEQLEAIKELDGYNTDMKMYDVVESIIKPITNGCGMGYSLYLNQDEPLRAKQMVSHAWGENYADFVQALKDSRAEGPFWVCAMAIYQENNETIAKQLGPDVMHGPFVSLSTNIFIYMYSFKMKTESNQYQPRIKATVLRQATDMIAIFTPAADIYLRMWCVFEIFVAVQLGVPIKFAALNKQVRSGIENIYDSIYEHGKRRCDSAKAECGQKSDENEIRSIINSAPGKFALLDSAVEWCKAKYYIEEVRSPGPAFSSPVAHLLLMGGSGKLDYAAKTLSSIALAIDRIKVELETEEEQPMEPIANIEQEVDEGTTKSSGRDIRVGDNMTMNPIQGGNCCNCSIQ